MGYQKSIAFKNPRYGAPGSIGSSKSNLWTLCLLCIRILAFCTKFLIKFACARVYVQIYVCVLGLIAENNVFTIP